MRGGMGGFPIEMVLDEEQRAEFREAMDGQRDKLRELDEKNMKLRRQLDEAMLAKELDEKEVRRLSLALAEIEADRTVLRARAFAKVRPSLTDEQLERLKNLRAEMGPGMRPGEGGFRQFPQRQPRPPADREAEDVLPPPAPPRPPDKPPR
jgi:Spy/CpxP family protein refolding chaperone